MAMSDMRNVAPPSHADFARYQRLFQIHDTDGSGTIDFRELRDIMVNNGVFLTEPQLRELMREHDIDNNDKIEFNEFVHMMQQSKARVQAKIVGRNETSRQRVERALHLGLLSPTSPTRWALDFFVVCVSLYYLGVAALETVFATSFQVNTAGRIAEIFLSLILIADVFVRFVTIPDTSSPPSTRGGVAIHYLRTWFAVDLIVALPVDLLLFVVGVADAPAPIYAPWDDQAALLASDGIDALPRRKFIVGAYAVYLAFRWIRACALIKLPRSWRVSHHGWLSPHVVAAARLIRWVRVIFVVAALVHILACAWAAAVLADGPSSRALCSAEGTVDQFGALAGGVEGLVYAPALDQDGNCSAVGGICAKPVALSHMSMWLADSAGSAFLIDADAVTNSGEVRVLARAPVLALHSRRDVTWPSDYVTALVSVVSVIVSAGVYRNAEVCTQLQMALLVLLCVLSMLALVFLITAVIVFATHESPNSERRAQLDTLASMLRTYNVPQTLQCEILSYMDRSMERAPNLYRDLLTSLPSAMQDHVGMYVRLALIDDVSIFKSLSPECKHMLAQTLTTVVVAPDDLVVTEGDGADSVFFLTLGALDVTRGDVRVATLRAGSIVGELALVGQGKRTATVRAVTYCELMQLSASNFRRILGMYHEFAVAVAGVVEKREAALGIQADDGQDSDCPTSGTDSGSDDDAGVTNSAAARARSAARAERAADAKHVCKGVGHCRRHFLNETRALAMIQRSRMAASANGVGGSDMVTSDTRSDMCGEGCVFTNDVCESHGVRRSDTKPGSPRRSGEGSLRDGASDGGGDADVGGLGAGGGAALGDTMRNGGGGAAGGQMTSMVRRASTARHVVNTIRSAARGFAMRTTRGLRGWGASGDDEGNAGGVGIFNRTPKGGRLGPAQSFFFEGNRNTTGGLGGGGGGLRGADVTALQELKEGLELLTSRMMALEGGVAFVAGVIAGWQTAPQTARGGGGGHGYDEAGMGSVAHMYGDLAGDSTPSLPATTTRDDMSEAADALMRVSADSAVATGAGTATALVATSRPLSGRAGRPMSPLRQMAATLIQAGSGGGPIGGSLDAAVVSSPTANATHATNGSSNGNGNGAPLTAANLRPFNNPSDSGHRARVVDPHDPASNGTGASGNGGAAARRASFVPPAGVGTPSAAHGAAPRRSSFVEMGSQHDSEEAAPPARGASGVGMGGSSGMGGMHRVGSMIGGGGGGGGSAPMAVPMGPGMGASMGAWASSVHFPTGASGHAPHPDERPERNRRTGLASRLDLLLSPGDGSVRKRTIRSSFRNVVQEAYKQQYHKGMSPPPHAPLPPYLTHPLVPPGVSFADAVATAVLGKVSAAVVAATAPIVAAAVAHATADVAAAAKELREQTARLVSDATSAASTAAVAKLTSELTQLRAAMALGLSGVSERIDAIAMVGDVSSLAPAACALADAAPALEALRALAGRHEAGPNGSLGNLVPNPPDGGRVGSVLPAFTLGPPLTAAAAAANSVDVTSTQAAMAALSMFVSQHQHLFQPQQSNDGGGGGGGGGAFRRGSGNPSAREGARASIADSGGGSDDDGGPRRSSRDGGFLAVGRDRGAYHRRRSVSPFGQSADDASRSPASNPSPRGRRRGESLYTREPPALSIGRERSGSRAHTIRRSSGGGGWQPDRDRDRGVTRKPSRPSLLDESGGGGGGYGGSSRKTSHLSNDGGAGGYGAGVSGVPRGAPPYYGAGGSRAASLMEMVAGGDSPLSVGGRGIGGSGGGGGIGHTRGDRPSVTPAAHLPPEGEGGTAGGVDDGARARPMGYAAPGEGRGVGGWLSISGPPMQRL